MSSTGSTNNVQLTHGTARRRSLPETALFTHYTIGELLLRVCARTLGSGSPSTITSPRITSARPERLLAGSAVIWVHLRRAQPQQNGTARRVGWCQQPSCSATAKTRRVVEGHMTRVQPGSPGSRSDHYISVVAARSTRPPSRQPRSRHRSAPGSASAVSRMARWFTRWHRRYWVQHTVLAPIGVGVFLASPDADRHVPARSPAGDALRD